MSKKAKLKKGEYSKRGRRYTETTKKAALAWVTKHGMEAATAKFGMSERSIQLWTKAYSKESKRRETAGQKHSPARPAQGKALVHASAAATVPGRKKGDESARQAHHGRRFSIAEKKAILEYAAEHGPTAASQEHRVSRWSIYEWQRRRGAAKAKKNPDEALAPRSSRPKHIPGKLSEERYHLIAETWLKNQALGPRQVSQLLRRNRAVRVSTSTARRVMEEHGYVPPKIKVEHRPSRSYEAVRPNQQWHLDFVHFYVHKVKLYLLFIEDDYSRYLPGWALCEGERAQPVLEAVDRAITRHGRPEQMVIDGGSGFFAWRGQSKLEMLCGDYGIDFIKASKLGANSKLEALNGNARKELLTPVEFVDIDDAHERIARWVHVYNFERVHQGLGGLLVPADRYFGRVEEVTAQLERGEPVVVPGPLPPDARALELFRVVSRGGRPELWLMGERIWPADSLSQPQ